MIAANLLSQLISPVKTSDIGEEVLTMMGVFQVKHLPIVNNEQLLGVISEDDILSQKVEDPIGSYALSMRRPFVHMDNNIFEIMKIMAEYTLSVIPVIDDEENYKGMISQDDIVERFSESVTFTQAGAVLYIAVDKQDFSLVELSNIVESEGALIIGFFLYKHEVPSKVRIILKLNKSEVSHIVASLQRYEYDVEVYSAAESDPDLMQDRYDSLMRYLNI